MPKPYPEEFRRDVVAVARKREAPLEQIAKDFGISETCLKNWLRQADIEDGTRPPPTRRIRRAPRGPQTYPAARTGSGGRVTG